MGWRLRARHRLHEPEAPVDRASDAEIVALLESCRSARDRLIVLLMARAGLRRGEVCGLRRSDVHLLADSRPLGCEVARAHLHVIRREDNPNGAWAKSRRQRAVPLDFLTVQAFDTYEFERMRVPRAASSDFVLVNLFREPVGAPMRPDAVGELVTAACGRAGLEGPSQRISSATPAGRTCWTRAARWMRPRTSSGTPRPRRLRFICTPTRPGCGLRSTGCPALASRAGRHRDRRRARASRTRDHRFRPGVRPRAGRRPPEGNDRTPGQHPGARGSWPRRAGIR